MENEGPCAYNPTGQNKTECDTLPVIPKKGTIHQPLNHFDRKNDKTFPQVQFIDATLHSHSSLNVISSEWHKNKKCHFKECIIIIIL